MAPLGTAVVIVALSPLLSILAAYLAYAGVVTLDVIGIPV